MNQKSANNIILSTTLRINRESSSPSTAALFLSLAFASSRSIDLYSHKVSLATEQSEADSGDKTDRPRQSNNGLQGSVLNRQSSARIAPARGPDGHGVLRDGRRLASELGAPAAGCHRGTAAAVVTVAVASCLLLVFEAEAFRRGRLSSVVLGHGEVCFVTPSDG
jgi:hypothetical protein